jgi:hypothetical protein
LDEHKVAVEQDDECIKEIDYNADYKSNWTL